MSSKRILILVNRTKTNKNSFFDGLKKNLPPDVAINIANFEDISIDIEEKSASILVNDKNILDYDLTYFRRAGGEFPWLASAVAVFLEHNNKKYFDSTYKEVGPRGSKFTDLLKLAIFGLPVVPTFICHKCDILKNSDKIIEKMGLPMVAKDLYSQRGLGVFLVKDKSDMEDLTTKFPNKKFMFQKFLNKKEEFRVLVLGNTVGSYERKTTLDPNEFRNNVSLGAREDFMEISEIADDVKDISIRSAETLKIEVAGVDVVIDKDDKLWILEVNMGPGFTYKSVSSHEVENVAKFFADTVRKIN